MVQPDDTRSDDLTSADILGPSGRIAARLSNYERRPQQLEMAAAVATAIRDKKHLVVEAGTGVGKSFGYLVPAILAATEPVADDKDEASGDDKPVRRVVISTHTISLQEQLIQKDIPFLNSVIPREFTAVLAKGRRNYLSRRRLQTALQKSASLFSQDEEYSHLREIRLWSRETTDGSLSDLPMQPRNTVWDEVASDSANCMGRKCKTYKSCLYYAARRRAENAQILIVNHALFFSDLALRRQEAKILPDYDAVIFDEAHTLEAVAGEHLGIGVTSGQVHYILNKLYNDRANKGLLVHHKLGRAQKEVLACHSLSEEFFDSVFQWLNQRDRTVARVDKAKLIANRLSPALDKLSKMINQRAEDIKDKSEKHDLKSAHERLQVLAGEIEAWRTQQEEESVYWVEGNLNRRNQLRMRLASAPIDVGPVLREHLFDKTRSVIATSATLSTANDGNFQFFQSRIGLTQANQVQLGSPFNYERQAKVVLLSGMPDPSSQRADFERLCSQMVRRYIERTDGHAFVLFTSYDLMRRVARDLGAWFTEQNMALYSQVDGIPRHTMVEQFKQNPRSVLFGADSFWQGVDVPGDALRNVIITKLPFSVPDQPLLQARLDAIRSGGGNPFRDYQLPEAVIKLKQGFGRLIRTAEDRGIVVILDPRVKTKQYGRAFLHALPKCEVVVEEV